MQDSLQMKAFDEQDILKPTWALSVLEFLLLVFKSLSCGEKCLLSAKTQRALEEKYLCEPGKDSQVFILGSFKKKFNLFFSFFFISCPELTGFSSTLLACSRLSAELLVGEREDFREKFCFCSSQGCCQWPLLGLGCRVGCALNQHGCPSLELGSYEGL